jgi:hypothetical protein
MTTTDPRQVAPMFYLVDLWHGNTELDGSLTAQGYRIVHVHTDGTWEYTT